MNSIPTSLTSVNTQFDDAAQALVALIAQYLNVQVYYGFRNIGVNDIVFPCVFVEPSREKQWMPKLGKNRLEATFSLYFYCQENNPEALVSQCNSFAANLKKLFSNNALNDLGSANSRKFYQYPNPNTGGFYWQQASVGDEVQYGPNFLNATPDNQQALMRGGVMTLTMLITDYVA